MSSQSTGPLPTPGDLEEEFEREAAGLLQANRREGLAAGIMRLRALSEISARLDAQALLELAHGLGED